MIAHDVQTAAFIGQETELNTDCTDFASSPTMVHSRSPSPEFFDILEATTVKLQYNMAAFTQAIREKEETQSIMFLDERYMSSEEALSLSPAGEELNMTDEEYEDVEVDDVLEDIMEVDEEEMQSTRSRSSSNSSLALIDCAVALTITNVGKPKTVEVRSSQATPALSTSASVISRQTSAINSSVGDGSVFVTPDSSPEFTLDLTKPSLPQRVRPALQYNFTNESSSSLDNALLEIPSRKESLSEAKLAVVETTPMTPQSMVSTPITNSTAATSPLTPATPLTPTRGSFFNNLGSKFSNLSKKEKRSALRISGPTNFLHVNASSPIVNLLPSPIDNDAANLAPGTPSRSATTTFSPITPANKDSDNFSMISKSGRFFRRKNSVSLQRAPSNATITSKFNRFSDIKMQPREEKFKVKDDFAKDQLKTPAAANDEEPDLMGFLAGSRLSVASMDGVTKAAAAVPKRKPVPNSAEKSKKRMSLLGRSVAV